MSITYVTSASLQGAGTLNYPAGTTPGDFLVLFCVGGSAPLPGSGWATIFSGGNTDVVYAKKAAGADTSVTITQTAGSNQTALAVMRGVSGVGTIGTESSSGTTSNTIPSITTTVPNAKVIGFYSIVSGNAGTFTLPAQQTARINISQSSTASGIGMADENIASAGATGTRALSVSIASGTNAGVLIAFYPSVSGFIGNNGQDITTKYTTKSYLLDAYPNLTPGRTSPGLWAWGQNTNGQLGYGTTTTVSSTAQVGALTNWKLISNSNYSTLAIKTDGTLWGCGANAVAQLGDGTIVSKSSPVQIGTLTTWKQVSNSGSGAFGIKTDGTLWAWGPNAGGQLGNGATATLNISTPIQIGTLTNWKAVASVDACTIAIKTDGTLWAWGNQSATLPLLGTGTTIAYSSPIQVGTSTNWKSLNTPSHGAKHNAAINTGSVAWLWGSNTYGQIGNGTTITSSSPIQVGYPNTWKLISCGAYNTYAIKTDGTLWAWGRSDNNGQLGNGTTINVSTPIQIGSLTNWKYVQAGLNRATALKTDGTLWAWGSNSFGVYGNNTTTSSSSPVQIGTSTSWKYLYSGDYSSTFAILDPAF